MIDWVNIAATFAATLGAAIAGSWFGSRATHAQTITNMRLENNRWLKEKQFEFLETIDEFVNFSFRKDELQLPERDRLTRKLLTLTTLVIPEKEKEIIEITDEVRLIHIGKKCRFEFIYVWDFFEKIRKDVKSQLKHLNQNNSITLKE